MKALVHHDLENQLDTLDEAQLLGLDLEVADAQRWGATFLSNGVLDERLLPWLWSELRPAVDARSARDTLPTSSRAPWPPKLWHSSSLQQIQLPRDESCSPPAWLHKTYM